MLVICSVTDTLILNTNYYGTTFSGMPLGNRNVRTSIYSLFQKTRAAQNVAPEGIQTHHLINKFMINTLGN